MCDYRSFEEIDAFKMSILISLRFKETLTRFYTKQFKCHSHFIETYHNLNMRFQLHVIDKRFHKDKLFHILDLSPLIFNFR